jgi:hypothetical protein
VDSGITSDGIEKNNASGEGDIRNESSLGSLRFDEI